MAFVLPAFAGLRPATALVTERAAAFTRAAAALTGFDARDGAGAGRFFVVTFLAGTFGAAAFFAAGRDFAVTAVRLRPGAGRAAGRFGARCLEVAPRPAVVLAARF